MVMVVSPREVDSVSPMMFVRRSRVCLLARSVRFAATVAIGLVVPFAAAPASAQSSTGAAVGDHWHIAFGIWNCGVWEPAITPGEDPLGIHTHGDGLIHLHPFAAAGAGKNAVLGTFLEGSGVTLTSTALTLSSKKLVAGKTCQGGAAVIRTLVWLSKKSTSPKTVTGDANKELLRDQEIIVIAYGPKNARVGLPPSVAELEDPADLPPPALSAQELAKIPAPPSSVPTIKPTGTPPVRLRITDRSLGTGAEATKGTRPYVRFALYLWRTGELLDVSSWKPNVQPLALSRLGKGRVLPGLEKGMLGMKVGGLREIVIPPSEGFGTEGSPPVLGTDTMVMVLQLVAVAK